MPDPIRPLVLPSRLRAICRKLRRESTIPERILWGLLRNRQLGDLKFRRQQVIGRYVVDFYCDEVKLVIEVDGESHTYTEAKDRARQRELESRGLNMIRFLNDDVLRDLEAMGLEILRQAGRLDEDSPSP